MTKMWERPMVYVAGPYTSPDPVENTHIAVLVGEELQNSGLVVCHVPHLSLLTHIISPHTDIEYWYEYDMSHLVRSDALYRIPGKSTGADAEVAFAINHDIPTFFTITDVICWAQNHPANV